MWSVLINSVEHDIDPEMISFIKEHDLRSFLIQKLKYYEEAVDYNIDYTKTTGDIETLIKYSVQIGQKMCYNFELSDGGVVKIHKLTDDNIIYYE